MGFKESRLIKPVPHTHALDEKTLQGLIENQTRAANTVHY